VSEPFAVTDADFEDLVLKSETPVLVDFWAPWCAPCKLVSPIVEAIGIEQGERMKVAKLDTDQSTATAQRYSVFSIPTLILFRDGVEAARWVGFQRREELTRRVTAALG